MTATRPARTPGAVIFDVGNVLIHWDARRVYRGLLPDEAAIDAFFAEVGFAAWNLEQDRGRTWADGVAALGAAFPHRAELIRAFDTRWQDSVPGAIDGTVALLQALGAAGVPCYALTNFSTEKWAESTARFPFLAGFRDAVVSGHEGVVKPDPRIFEICLTRNGLDAAACVFVDDSAANVHAARGVGLDAVRFTDPATLATDLRARGLPV